MRDNPIVKGQMLCVALNDSNQFNAMQAEFNQPPYKEAPTQPVLYFKPHNTWNIEGAEIEWPQNANLMVVGASLAVVIGRTCCRTSVEQALDFVQGYTLMHDFSLPEESYYRPDIKGKCLDGSAPIGANVIPAAQVNDLSTLEVITEINNKQVNCTPVSQLVRGVPELISIISRIMTLQAGDVIAVGFPGQRAEVKQGDLIHSSIAGVTELNNKMGVEKV